MQANHQTPRMVCVPVSSATARVSTDAGRVTIEARAYRASWAWFTAAAPTARRAQHQTDRWVRVY